MKKTFFSLLILIALALGSQAAYAQNTNQQYTLLEPLPCIAGTGNNCAEGTVMKTISFDTYIEYIFKFSIALAVFLAVIMIIVGGFEYMVSESPFGKSNGKSRITNAIVGLLGALVSYLILLTIDPRLVQVNSQLPPIKINTSEIINFQNQLAQYIRDLSADDINKVNQLEQQIKEKDARLQEIIKEGRFRAYTEAENTEKAKLIQEMGVLKSEQAQTIARASSGNSFRSTLSELRRLDAYSTSGVLNASSATSNDRARQNIKDAYTRALNDEGVKKNPALVQSLEFERDFYLAEINKEQAMMIRVVQYEESTTKSPAVKKELQTYLTRYENELKTLNDPADTSSANLQKVRSNERLNAQHQLILSDRITTLKKTIGTTTPARN